MNREPLLMLVGDLNAQQQTILADIRRGLAHPRLTPEKREILLDCAREIGREADVLDLAR